MLMFVDMGEGGVGEKITDYVDMGRGLQKYGPFCFKSAIYLIFSRHFFIFLIYLHI